MSRIYFKENNKKKIKTLIFKSFYTAPETQYDDLLHDECNKFEDNIVLIKYNKEYKTYIRQFTSINDDLIDIIYEYTIKEIELNIQIDHQTFDSKDCLK